MLGCLKQGALTEHEEEKTIFKFYIAAFGKIFSKNAKRSACLRYN
jgi:hypothetical protein